MRRRPDENSLVIHDARAWSRFSFRTVDRVAATGSEWLLRSYDAQQLVCLSADRNACHTLDGRRARVVYRGHCIAFGPLRGDAEHCGGCDRLVLAFHGRGMDFNVMIAGICQLTLLLCP